MDLPTVWFLLIAVLFTGYFVLEGFDFGVGILLPVLGRDDRERRVLINTIGPVWDGNEVWLITAVGALFAAFPAWYASLLSGFYLPLLLVLLALIFRGVAFEYRHKRPDPRWKARWDLAIFLGSLLPAAIWGVLLGNLLRGVPLDARGDHTGGLLDLLNPYALLGGATTTALFVTHGAVFLALKTTGEIRVRAGRLAARAAGATAAVTAAFLAASLTLRHTPAAVALAAAAGLALAGTLAASRVRREGWAFTGTAAAIGLTVATLFAALFPTVLPSTADPAGTLTVANAASSPYTLTVMTWVAAFFTPVVLGYQGWTYWVFRKRIGIGNIPR
ncbi:cytochrome d ubiquinol oxidase subunit II [Plantactinospora sp. WMMB782]|uniref:cytochrome d ubiquinol oxidase subunit II n=1 Tax=Plantactinospora sp. WMMB782 TaxID=3404121 RepID=UPI003B95C0EC